MKALLIQFKNSRSPQHSGESILLSTLSILKNNNPNPQKTLVSAIKHLCPGVKVLIRIKSGRPIPLPAYQSEHSANYYAIRWLLKAAQDRTKKSFVVTDLVNEIYDTLNSKGRAFKSYIDSVKALRDARVNYRKKFKKFKKFKKKRITRMWSPYLKKMVYKDLYSHFSSYSYLKKRNIPKVKKNKKGALRTGLMIKRRRIIQKIKIVKKFKYATKTRKLQI